MVLVLEGRTHRAGRPKFVLWHDQSRGELSVAEAGVEMALSCLDLSERTRTYVFNRFLLPFLSSMVILDVTSTAETCLHLVLFNSSMDVRFEGLFPANLGDSSLFSTTASLASRSKPPLFQLLHQTVVEHHTSRYIYVS